MKRFHFRFESVEKMRRVRERRLLGELADAQRALQQRIDEREQTRRSLDESLVRRERLGSVQVVIQAFQIEDAYVQGLKKRLIQDDRAVLRAQKAVEKAMRFYIEARKALKGIEKLREKDYEEYRREQRKIERKETEDLIVMRSGLGKENA